MPLFCPECEASNPKDGAFCTSCGTALAADPAPQTTAPRRRQGRTSSARQSKVRPRHQITSAARAVARVRVFFFAMGCLSTLALAAVLFGMLHCVGGLIGFPHRFAGGLLFGWLRERTGSLAPCIIAHAVHNGLAVWGFS
ncbi:MAG: CPBP family glutamic-type intramembrane protease [Planctomycetota bacterium]